MSEFEKLKNRYEQGRISISMLKKYVQAGHITAEQFTEITGQPYEA